MIPLETPSENPPSFWNSFRNSRFPKNLLRDSCRNFLCFSRTCSGIPPGITFWILLGTTPGNFFWVSSRKFLLDSLGNSFWDFTFFQVSFSNCFWVYFSGAPSTFPLATLLLELLKKLLVVHIGIPFTKKIIRKSRKKNPKTFQKKRESCKLLVEDSRNF